MCIDVEARQVFLFGGWDGHINLGDLWLFKLDAQEWVLLSANTQAQGGPSPRSCHKICLDPKRKVLYTLGYFVDITDQEHDRSYTCDFYMYDIVQNVWTCLSENTAADGGPSLIFDHQMCIDSDKNDIYVFGGR